MRMRSAVACLESFTRIAPQSRFPELREMLPTLAQLLYTLDEETLTHSLTALAALSDPGPISDRSHIQSIIEWGVSRRVVELLMHKTIPVKTAALAVVVHLTRGDDVQRQVLLNCSVLPCLLSLLVHAKRVIRLRACVVLSHICLGNVDQIGMVVDANIIPPLMYILRNGESEVQRAALAAISRILTRGSDPQVRYLVNQDAIGALCPLLTGRDCDVILLALDGLESILRVGAQDAHAYCGNDDNQYATMVEECGGMDSIESLQVHETEEIYKKAGSILRICSNANAEVEETEE